MKTAEAVRNGHPDKVCDLIADALLDEYLRRDPMARVALEIQGGHGKVNIMGEVRTPRQLHHEEISEITQKTYRERGYDDNLDVSITIDRQSAEIAGGVDTGGAGDSGIVVGYATNETQELLPKEFVLARRIKHAFDETDDGKEFGPDGKMQVTIDEGGLATIVVASIQHHTPLEKARKDIEEIIRAALKEDVRSDCKFYVNPAGPFTVGGFSADTGLSGRKIVQDQYGPRVPVGGGSFSGKDATKVDRSGAYFARSIAVDLVKRGKCNNATVWLAWAIGVPKPIWKKIETEPAVPSFDISKFDVSVEEIIKTLDLLKPNFYWRTKLGHYGFSGF